MATRNIWSKAGSPRRAGAEAMTRDEQEAWANVQLDKGDSGTRPLVEAVPTNPRIDYEAHYSELAQRPGFEGLVKHIYVCPSERGLNCNCVPVPLPEAERLGMLVEVALRFKNILIVRVESGIYVTVDSLYVGHAPKPWQAVTEALRQAGRKGGKASPAVAMAPFGASRSLESDQCEQLRQETASRLGNLEA